MIDLVMWTLNGEKTLGKVLKRINSVVPANKVNQRLIVDDASTDGTVEVAEKCGWNVVANNGTGISDGANTALGYVETECFASFEQDLYLASNWWERVGSKELCGDVAARSGIRQPYPCLSMFKLHEYTAERYVKRKGGLPSYLCTDARNKASMSWGRTLDNTLFDAEVLRRLGGFPVLPVCGGVDTVLTWRYINAGYKWDIDFDVVSLHLNKTLFGSLRSEKFYGSCWDAISFEVPILPMTLTSAIYRFLLSPLSSLHPAIMKRCPSIVMVYPLCRLQVIRGIVYSRKHGGKAIY